MLFRSEFLLDSVTKIHRSYRMTNNTDTVLCSFKLVKTRKSRISQRENVYWQFLLELKID